MLIKRKHTYVKGGNPKCILCRHGMTRRNIRIQRESKLHTCPCSVGGWQNKRCEFSMQKRCRVICRLKHENLIMIIMLYSSCNGNGLSSLYVFLPFFICIFVPDDCEREILFFFSRMELKRNSKKWMYYLHHKCFTCYIDTIIR